MTYVTVHVNEKGQVVIPKFLREAYGIEPNSEVLIGEKEDSLVIERKLSVKEFASALDSFPKRTGVKVDSDADYAEEMESR
ncbi:AbrB/MazE/SpoVT family DNA-binding domain-containing protein [Candidatus Micrarchaeota archaeon]|nr:AbrB/MazE/SpoVT family DNA-binding domain-containing protein [Candidatus Micrarchaeota archaeon]MBI5176843.1 AbrB/MazE/SpoVT family DNA-binding domain-containing protein [Candidatus Micrarchaeota archaeon]